MKRLYRCPVVGSGVGEDNIRPSLAKHAGIAWEARQEFKPGAKTMTVEVEATLAQHAVIVLDTTIEVLL